MPRAGRYDTRIRLEYRVATQDPNYGTEIVSAWIPLIALPGSPTEAVPIFAEFLDELPSRDESARDSVAIARKASRVRFRYLDGYTITPDMRVVRMAETETIYQIIGGPAILGRREQIELMVERYSS